MRHHHIAWALPADASEPHGLTMVQELDRDTVLCGPDGDSAEARRGLDLAKQVCAPLLESETPSL